MNFGDLTRDLGLVLALVPVLGCGGSKDGGRLHAQRKALEREVGGLRAVAGRLERGDPALPEGDVVVAIGDELVRELLTAQLPFEVQTEKLHIRLQRAEVRFRGNALVVLQGTVALASQESLQGELSVQGAFERIVLDPASGTMHASVAVDHVDVTKVAGLEALLSGASLDEFARELRLQIQDKLPEVTIPVRIQQRIELPAFDDGTVRIAAAALPLSAQVSEVLAVEGQLWMALRVELGKVQ